MASVEFLPGQESKEAKVTIINDYTEEEDEVFFAILVAEQPNVLVPTNNSISSIKILDEDKGEHAEVVLRSYKSQFFSTYIKAIVWMRLLEIVLTLLILTMVL